MWFEYWQLVVFVLVLIIAYYKGRVYSEKKPGEGIEKAKTKEARYGVWKQKAINIGMNLIIILAVMIVLMNINNKISYWNNSLRSDQALSQRSQRQVDLDWCKENANSLNRENWISYCFKSNQPLREDMNGKDIYCELPESVKAGLDNQTALEIGRASCRERVYVQV
jgi:hypothetical protein